MADLRFDGRVAVVTGAGAGLGRAYALLLASRGAKVVVNDLGGGRDGDGSSSNAADRVVEEIRRNGGTAVGDYNSVVEGGKIIKTALDNYGRVDILINNAGILRDKSFANISDKDWDIIHEVHLKGSFKTTQAAFPIFKKQGFGRIIMTSSESGIYGNFGQANYAAAKMALIGLSNTIAIEGANRNVYCNVIVPTAGSRLTEDVLPSNIFAELKPALIAPVVCYLCHETCTENGVIIDSAAGWAGKLQIVRSSGALLRKTVLEDVEIENVRDNWEMVVDMSQAEHFNSLPESTLKLMSTLEQLREDGIQKKSLYEFCDKDLILYALGVGASLSRPNELKYLYECHEDFTALPTFFCLLSLTAINDSDLLLNAIPGKPLDFSRILHGEHSLTFCGDVPREGTLYSTCKVAEVLDKGTGAVVVVNVDTYTKSGELVIKNQNIIFVPGHGNYGGPRVGNAIIPVCDKPERDPDLSVLEKTSIDQAALYRLSGDHNPLHIDKDIARIAGFPKPLLHGLSTLGFSVRIIMNSYAGGDSKLFQSCKVRFMHPVYPGETLKVNMWRNNLRIHFETAVVERSLVVIGGAYVDLKEVKMSPAKNNVQLQSDAIFQYIIDTLKADPNKGKAVGGCFLYNITKDGKVIKQWTMDLKNALVYEGEPDVKPNTTLTISDEDFMDLAQGKLQPQVAFMKGKLKITGNIMLAQKLGPILKANVKL